MQVGLLCKRHYCFEMGLAVHFDELTLLVRSNSLLFLILEHANVAKSIAKHHNLGLQ